MKISSCAHEDLLSIAFEVDELFAEYNDLITGAGLTSNWIKSIKVVTQKKMAEIAAELLPYIVPECECGNPLGVNAQYCDMCVEELHVNAQADSETSI